ncbi:hypothetical protein KCP76_26090 (plasmid) [Salmonella enterica subsp. enterica serovar Weltevreden]|nr:hypothetical protein KCP76_26090 [Salmonella enterica subsp. enterica serovar Weltevreden]
MPAGSSGRYRQGGASTVAVNGGNCSGSYRSGTAMWLSRPHRKNHCGSGAGRPFPSGAETSAT